jgi:hypothetical protein
MKSDEGEKYSEQEAERRLEKTLQGAFSGPPMPLKDIPTRWGKKRAERDHPRPKRRRRQRKKRAA